MEIRHYTPLIYVDYCYFFSIGNIELFRAYQNFSCWENLHVHSLPPPSPIYGQSVEWRNSEERQLIFLEPQGIFFKENEKHITKFLKLLKNASCRMKISKHVESNVYKSIEVLNFA